jgi:hypothetical protein
MTLIKSKTSFGLGFAAAIFLVLLYWAISKIIAVVALAALTLGGIYWAFKGRKKN